MWLVRRLLNSIRVTANCTGTAQTSDIVEAFDWIVANAPTHSITNFSFSSNSYSIRHAMDNTILDGHVIVTGAGNDNINDCWLPTYPLQRYKSSGAINVGATDNSDTRSSFSNYGPCVSISAPGTNITGAAFNSNSGSVVLSGTSMASPLVAGIAALYSGAHPGAAPYEVMEAVIDSATINIVTDIKTSKNKLAFSEPSMPNAFWKKTGTVIAPINPEFFLPVPGCTLGQKAYKVIGEYPQQGMFLLEVWTCS
ncbi:MAG: S8 family serine peptidase [Marinagarivorans sp.]|nr:S8 family serine peptidase [Marinagarivorans sp.]